MLSELDELKIGDIRLERDQSFGDELTAYTDSGNYALVIFDSIDKRESYNTVDIQVFVYLPDNGELSLFKTVKDVAEQDLKRTFLRLYSQYNEFDQ